MQSRRTSIGIAAGVAAFALALIQDGGASSASLPLAALSTAGKLRPIAAVGPLDPDGVPIPDAPPLARRRVVSDAEQIDGITCQAREQVLFHIHAHLTIFVRGRRRQVPEGDRHRAALRGRANAVRRVRRRRAHAQIHLDVGRPLVAPEHITVPNGL